MTIGGMRKQVAIQSEAQTPDGAGGYALGWNTIATVWAEIEPLHGHEVLSADHLEGRVTHKVTMRFRSDLSPITTAMRLLYNSRAFNIHAVLNTGEDNRFLSLMVEEGGPI